MSGIAPSNYGLNCLSANRVIHIEAVKIVKAEYPALSQLPFGEQGDSYCIIFSCRQAMRNFGCFDG